MGSFWNRQSLLISNSTWNSNWLRTKKGTRTSYVSCTNWLWHCVQFCWAWKEGNTDHLEYISRTHWCTSHTVMHQMTYQKMSCIVLKDLSSCFMTGQTSARTLTRLDESFSQNKEDQHETDPTNEAACEKSNLPGRSHNRVS